MRNRKTELILRAIIKAYLSEQNPVGSLLLQDSLNMPASTLRMYFKKLSDDGMLSKHHSSSGRTPTTCAMKAYWREYFLREDLSTYHIDVLNDSAFFKLLNKYELFCLSIVLLKNHLIDVLNIKDKHLFLEFSKFVIVLPFEPAMAQLFSELIGCDEASILQVLRRLGLEHIAHALAKEIAVHTSFSHNLPALLEMSPGYARNVVDEAVMAHFCGELPDVAPLDKWLHEEFSSFCIDATYAKRPIKLFVCGSVYTDFEGFFNTLKEVV